VNVSGDTSLLRQGTPTPAARTPTIDRMAPSTNDIDATRAADLLIAARGGCTASMHALISLCEPFVTRRARHDAWHRDQADDIVQEVWVKLLVHAGQIRDPEALLGWLSIVTRRAAARIGHREHRAVPTEDVAVGIGVDSAEDGAIEHFRREVVTGHVRQALGRLGDDERTLLLLLHHQDRPNYRDISQRVSRPIGSLGPSRQRLLRRLRRDRDIASLESFVTAA
jgi:RNA polymerase sigma factor (sigma-70 family)